MPAVASPNSSYMLDVVRGYLAAGGKEPLDLDELADYAIANGLFGGKTKIRQLCKRAFSNAFREQYHVDPQGRSVRTMYSVTENVSDGQQRVFWQDTRKASHEFMEDSVQQRRKRIVGEYRCQRG